MYILFLTEVYLVYSGIRTNHMKLSSGDEFDAHSKFGKRYLRWRAGQRKKVKQSINRRQRRIAKNGSQEEKRF
jgi:hypothetical protein